MYCKPHLICVAALVCQSGPALAMRDPGSACGMPKAPDPGLAAVTLQLLSCSHSGSRQENWLDDQPNEPSIAWAICCGEPDAAVVTAGLWAAAWPRAAWLCAAWLCAGWLCPARAAAALAAAFRWAIASWTAARRTW